jgi:hypothetical protein
MDIRFWGKLYAVEAGATIVQYGLHNMKLHTTTKAQFIYWSILAYYKDRGFFDNRFWNLAVYSKFVD